MLSAALSRVHVLPPLVVLNRTPLPPAAQASSCKKRIHYNMTVVTLQNLERLLPFGSLLTCRGSYSTQAIFTCERYPTSSIPKPRLCTGTSSNSSVSWTWKNNFDNTVKIYWEQLKQFKNSMLSIFISPIKVQQLLMQGLHNFIVCNQNH